jgi:hypothetical protein
MHRSPDADTKMATFDPQQGPEKIRFKPISAGLGFHTTTESSALPTPPLTSLRGSGAIAAGPARPVPIGLVTPKFATPVPALEKGAAKTSLWKRGVAYFLDTLLYWSLCSALLLVASVLLRVEISQFAAPEFVGLALAFLAVFSWSVIAAQEVVFGTTLGKRLFDLELQGSPFRILLRAIFFVLTFLIAPISAFLALRDPEHRALHDRISGIAPFESARIEL